MNCDVNGENWPLVDLLLDLGIEGFTMAINTHFGGRGVYFADPDNHLLELITKPYGPEIELQPARQRS